MDCKQVLFLLQHSEDFQKINSKEKTALQEHLQHCLSCRHEYELTQKLEGLLQQLYHYPLLPSTLHPRLFRCASPSKTSYSPNSCATIRPCTLDRFFSSSLAPKYLNIPLSLSRFLTRFTRRAQPSYSSSNPKLGFMGSPESHPPST
jgi:hypothetical protein